ncbi:MAG: proline racemase family protein [Acetobacteraceae bacterium]|nr:proline racemase family protein [Acetobacteraceae bacterium]
MRWSRMMTLVDAHCEGEIGRVVTGGGPILPGATMLERMNFLNGPRGSEGDSLRRFLVFEPRGMAHQTVNLLQPPCDPAADAAFIVLQADRAHAMSGSNAICVTTVLLETGMVRMAEPETVVRLDTPAGLVVARAACRDGKCVRVALEMPASFAPALDQVVTVEGVGDVKFDLAFGGVFYALVDVAALGRRIEPEQLRALVGIGARVLPAAEAKLAPKHPTMPALSGISYVMFCGEDEQGWRTCTIVNPGRADRSPCGTGSSARLAATHARGLLKPGQRIVSRSIIGSRFDVSVARQTSLGDVEAIVPRIEGSGWIHGTAQLGVDPSDPFQLGFALPDIWGPGLPVADQAGR